MSPFDTFLVLIEENQNDAITVPISFNEALRHDAGLVLLRVIERPEICVLDCYSGGPLPRLACVNDRTTQEECRQSLRYLEQLRHEYHLPDPVQCVVRTGDTVHHVEREAMQHGRTLVVVTTISATCEACSPHRIWVEELLHHGKCEMLLIDGKSADDARSQDPRIPSRS